MSRVPDGGLMAMLRSGRMEEREERRESGESGARAVVSARSEVCGMMDDSSSGSIDFGRKSNVNTLQAIKITKVYLNSENF